MIYLSYNEPIEDLKYIENIYSNCSERFRYSGNTISSSISNNFLLKEIKKEWMNHVQKKIEATKSSNTPLGKFLKQYPLEFKEFCCFLELIKDGIGRFSIDDISGVDENKNPFEKYKIRYESSQLKRFKLIYRIINPMQPLRTIYEISYKAQLALKNQKYTNEYEQLDLALEEESKRNSPDSLESLYYVIEPKLSFNDIIISDKTKESLLLAKARDQQKDKIFNQWGFKNILGYGTGTTLNFRGPPGTGKTLAANVLAKELGKKLLMVRYDQIQSMWCGETEKHIKRVFNLASKKNAVLFFDEADAIALNRATLNKSWEMSQVNTLLKELERYKGVCIFATNFAEKYDPAFERRLTLHIDFEMPNKEQCQKILYNLLPIKSRDKNLSLEILNLERFSGGDLKNIALNAAGIAVKRKAEKISLNDIKEAIAMAENIKKGGYNSAYLG